jgi:predicted DNA-binding transcriptional regulator AlpA
LQVLAGPRGVRAPPGPLVRLPTAVVDRTFAYGCMQHLEPVTPNVESEQLVGAAEIAQRLGLAQAQTVHLWRRRYADFPQPVATLQQALIWYWPDVERWARQTRRLK